MSLGDSNGDGATDLAAGSIAKNAILLSLSGSAGRSVAMLSPIFVPPTGSSATGGSRDIVGVDLDEDGREDLATITPSPIGVANADNLVVFRCLTGGGFGPAEHYLEAGNRTELIAVDLNDGRTDLVSFGDQERRRVMQSAPGTSTLGPRTSWGFTVQDASSRTGTRMDRPTSPSVTRRPRPRRSC